MLIIVISSVVFFAHARHFFFEVYVIVIVVVIVVVFIVAQLYERNYNALTYDFGVRANEADKVVRKSWMFFFVVVMFLGCRLNCILFSLTG